MLTDQAQNDLHITVTCVCLQSLLDVWQTMFLKISCHFVLDPYQKEYSTSLQTNKHFQALSRKGKSEDGTQSACLTSSWSSLLHSCCVVTQHSDTEKLHRKTTSSLLLFHSFGMEIRKNWNKCPIWGDQNPDKKYHLLTQFRPFKVLKISLDLSKNSSWKLGVVHRGSPWTGSTMGSID